MAVRNNLLPVFPGPARRRWSTTHRSRGLGQEFAAMAPPVDTTTPATPLSTTALNTLGAVVLGPFAPTPVTTIGSTVETLAGNPTYSVLPVSTPGDLAWNVGGTVSPNQLAYGQGTEISSLEQAGMDALSAQQAASTDWNSQLAAAAALPSQNPAAPLLNWLGIGGGSGSTPTSGLSWWEWALIIGGTALVVYLLAKK